MTHRQSPVAPAFVGYWGLGHAPSLQAQLRGLLPRGDQVAWGTRTAGPEGASVGSVSWVWQVASLGSPPRIPRFAAPGAFELIAGISPSGLSRWSHPDGQVMPEAWVLIGRDGATGQRVVRLGREPFGRAPLYWHQKDGVLWFASQAQRLLPLIEKPAISVPGLYSYSCFSYVATPHTPIQGLEAVPAGMELRWQADAAEPSRWRGPQSRPVAEWREAPDPLCDESVAIARLRDALQAAIQRQIGDLRPDQPVAVALSGGLDSSITAALLVQAGLRVRAYTLDLAPPGKSEAPYAQSVADALGIPLVRVPVTPQRARQALRATVRALDLPFGDGVTVPLFLLAERAAHDTAVLFNGEGGDQLFAGWTNKPLIAAGVYHRSQGGAESFAEHYLRTFHRLWGLEERVFQPATLARVRQLHAGDFLRDALDPGPAPSLLHRLRRASLRLKGAQNIQPRASHLGQFHGLAVRSPFCDQALAELSFAIAPALHLRGACEKYILKRAVEPWLPEAVVWRAKRGMGIPLTHWCLTAFWHDLGDCLNPAVLAREGHWQADLASRLVNGTLSASLDGRRLGESLWLLLMWQLWRQEFLPASEVDHSWQHPFWLPPWLWRMRRRWRDIP